MFIEYVNAAMRNADYQDFDDGSVYAHIPALRGVWANEPTREAAEAELRSALEDWIRFRIVHNRPIPTIEGIIINAALAR